MRKAIALAGAILLSCGSSSSVASSSSTPAPSSSAPAATQPAATAAPATTRAAATATAPAATSAPAASAAAGRADINLKWDTGANIADVDDITDIVTHLKQTPGIIGGFGDETQITITYDPRLITVDRIRAILKDMAFPTKAP